MAFQAYEEDAPKPRNDAYTGILAISFFAMLIACLLLLVDWYSYENVKGPERVKITPVKVPPAAAPAKAAPKGADVAKPKEEKGEKAMPKEDGPEKAKAKE